MLGESTHISPPVHRAFFSTLFPGQAHHSGTAIFVRNDIPFIHLQIHSLLQIVAVKVFINRFYTLCSLYLPPSVPIERNELDILLNALPSSLLLLGDFNGRYPLWDDDTVNPRGLSLASFIEGSELEILNSGDVTHFQVQAGTFTTIDLSLSVPLISFLIFIGVFYFPILLVN